MVILRFTGEGEVFYRQKRVGKDGRMFYLLKFATNVEKIAHLMGTPDQVTKLKDGTQRNFEPILEKFF